MRRILINDTCVALDDDGDRLAAFESFPLASHARETDMVVRVRAVGAVPVAPPNGFEQKFFHGNIRGYVRKGDFMLTDGTSSAHVTRGTRELNVDLQIADGDRALGKALVLLSVALALRHRGLFHVHAAGVVTVAGLGIVIAGDSGAGKSTCALAMMAHGCSYLGDDALLAAKVGDGVHLFALRAEPRVGARTLAALPALRPFASTQGPDGKHAINGELAFPDRWRLQMPQPQLLVFPRISAGEATRTEAMSSADALGSLLHASAMIGVEGVPGVTEQLEMLRTLVDGARAVRIVLGQDALGCLGDIAAELQALAA